VIAAILAAFLLLVTLVLSDAQNPAAGQPISGVGADPLINSTALALGVFVRLILVVIAIYIGAMLLRRWQVGNNRRLDRQLSLVETLHLSQRRSVHLVRAGEQVFLIGSTDQAVTLLGQVVEKANPDSSRILVGGAISFDQHLSAASQKNIDLLDLK
jgi:flagellar biosynthetic protein FliO